MTEIPPVVVSQGQVRAESPRMAKAFHAILRTGV
jgi:hypothetical protein